jgi:tRNA (guanine37-N1)-methyltransferase
MRFTIVTIFPEMFASFLDATLLGRARQAGIIDVRFVDPRDFTEDKHRSVDDSPYGGGPGMVMNAPPLLAAIESAGAGLRILLSPAGAPLSQARVRELAALDHIVLVCGRYEGVDERVHLAIDEDVSIGDYVLSGGEPAAMVVVDAVSRYVPGVLGEATSVVDESFSEPLLEYPQFTRPADVRGHAVPAVLQSGNHAEIAAWRRAQSIARTAARRADLMPRYLARAVAANAYVCLAHHPVLDPDGAIVTTSITNLDIHDIARSASTYGLAGYYAVTPITAQREMIGRIIANWQDTAARNETRGVALAAVRGAASIEDVIDDIARRHKRRPHVVATSAKPRPEAVAMPAPPADGTPLLIVFGTGHGLADSVFLLSDQTLVPIEGAGAFNHLSVRSAVAAILDRLFGKRTP